MKTAFHQSELDDAKSNPHYSWIFCHNQYIRTVFHQCDLDDDPFNSQFRMNFLSQSGQANGFSPVWFRRCRFKALLEENFLSHSRQTHGFSPIWIRRCLFNSLLVLNFLSQSLQTNGFSPVWILRWTFKWLFSLKLLVTVSTGERLFTSVDFTILVHFAIFSSCHNQDRRTAFHLLFDCYVVFEATYWIRENRAAFLFPVNGSPSSEIIHISIFSIFVRVIQQYQHTNGQ